MILDRAVGIDLGTTNSEVSLLAPDDQQVLVYADRFGRRIVPSAVAWDPKAERLVVGFSARNRRGLDPEPVESIKRKMGRDGKVEIGPMTLEPEEVSAKILEELRDRMAEFLGPKAEGYQVRVRRAVITVPAYFDAPQVEATRRAGELAGLEVVGILQEPTAAAVYHAWKRKLGEGNFLVYDLGGGTFDVSIIRSVMGEYQVLAIDGDNYLGGDDFDRRFAEYLRRALAERGYALDLDVAGDPEDRRRFGCLVRLAQELKEALSTSEVQLVQRTNLFADKAGEPVSIDLEIGRAHWEKLQADLVEQTLAACERALIESRNRAGVGLEDIDYVLLVGGSTRAPIVPRLVAERFCGSGRSKAKEPIQDDVDVCVALGAAIHAANLGGLRLGTDDGGTIVEIGGTLLHRTERGRISGRIVAAPEEATEVVLEPASGVEGGAAPVGAWALDPERRFKLVDVPLPVAGENLFSLVIRDASARQVARFPLALYRGEGRPRSTGLSQPAVLAKDICLELVKAGRRDRRTVLARGSSLPAQASHRFYTADQSGAVVLRLLQGRLPIRTIHLEVPPDLPLYTPVDLKLECDEKMTLEASGDIAGRTFWARIDPPRGRPVQGWDAIEAMLDEVEEVGRKLWGFELAVFRRESEPLVAAIREVVRTDPDKLQVLAGRLENLLEDFRSRETGLSPSYDRFAGILDDLRRTVYRACSTDGERSADGARQGPLGLSLEDWETRIGDVEKRGMLAWDRADAGGWRRAYNEAQALWETATQEEFAAMRLDDPTYVRGRLLSIQVWAQRLAHQLGDFVPSDSEGVRPLQLSERDRLLAQLETEVLRPLSELPAGPPADSATRAVLEQCGSQLRRIESAIERLPSIGLVTEREG
ncbi:MAG: Hsp70 family protein [Deltaproteobacteria bacterium]|nr:Hsp70 family protein [Deltaproteobacteria bacterium]